MLHRQQQRVVGDHFAAASVSAASGGVEPGEGVGDQGHADIGRDRRQVVVQRALEREWLAHRHRPIHELRLWSQHGDRHAVAGQISQRQRSLDSGDTPACDENVERLM